MTVRITKQGCKVETTCTIQPNGTYTESVVLSVDPASKLALAIEERAGQSIGTLSTKWSPCPPKWKSTR